MVAAENGGPATFGERGWAGAVDGRQLSPGRFQQTERARGFGELRLTSLRGGQGLRVGRNDGRQGATEQV